MEDNTKNRLEELEKEFKEIFDNIEREHQEFMKKVQKERDKKKQEFMASMSQATVDNAKKAKEDIADCRESLRKSYNLKMFLKNYGEKKDDQS